METRNGKPSFSFELDTIECKAFDLNDWGTYMLSMHMKLLFSIPSSSFIEKREIDSLINRNFIPAGRTKKKKKMKVLSHFPPWLSVTVIYSNCCHFIP
jgi:hypothetical protein